MVNLCRKLSAQEIESTISSACLEVLLPWHKRKASYGLRKPYWPPSRRPSNRSDRLQVHSAIYIKVRQHPSQRTERGNLLHFAYVNQSNQRAVFLNG